MEKKEKNLPFYARDDEIRTILYSDMKINDSNYSAADVCFICDTTGSMDRYIEPMREFLLSFVNEIVRLIYGCPRVAFIAYKDKSDGENQIKSKGFTTKYDEVINFVEGIECGGGDDTCEDIVTPLMEALKFDWSSDLNYVYLITDAPTHGKRYHKDKWSDDYPNDDKDKLLEKLVSHYRKNKINLTILRCNDSVDEMIKIIKEYYNSPANELKVININDEDSYKKDFIKHFYSSLTNSIREFFISSRNRNYRRISEKDPEPEEIQAKYKMEYETPFTGEVNTGSIEDLAFEGKKYKYSISLTSSAEVECKISGSIISSGVFVNCYSLHVNKNTNYIAKIPKIVAKKAEDLLSEIEGTLLTKVLADKFNFLLKQAENEDKENQVRSHFVQVLPLTIIQNLDFEKSKSQTKRPKFFLAQQLLEGIYIKFNNNYGWKNEEKDSYNFIAQAFSHFTYEYTMGVIMVTDIQGIKGSSGEIIITDPAIHSFLYKERFGQTNHGKLGMIRFFMTHECNDYCKMLHLIDPNSISKDRVKAIKEERKGEEALNHLYKEFKPNIKEWRSKIQSFDPNLDPELDDDFKRITNTRRFIIKPENE